MRVHPININPLVKGNYYGHTTEIISDNTTLPANDVLNFLNITGSYNLSFKASKTPFYAIKEDGTYEKFFDRKVAEEKLSLAKSNIAECLQGKRTQTHGYSFVYASEIESKNESGDFVIDEAKLNKKLKELEDALKKQDKPIPIYAIDEKGKATKYASKYQASKKLGVSTPHIIKVLNKEIKKTGGYAFAFPEEIEKELSSGGKIIDKEKLSAIYSTAFEETNSTAVYAIHKEGYYRKFNGIREAGRILSLESANISRCLAGNQKRVGDYTFIRAEEVESKDEFDRLIIDSKRIKELNGKTQIKESSIPLYTIDSNGKTTRYPSKNEAAKAIGVDTSRLNHCLEGRYNVVNGYSLILAEDVESETKDGKIELNYDLLEEKYNEANKNAIYSINKNGEFHKFFNQTEAANELGLRRNKISGCINGLSSRVGDMAFIKAQDIETFDNGKIIFNTVLLKRIVRELLTPRLKAVYFFDKDGRYQRFESAKKAGEALSIPHKSITNYCQGEKETSKGLRFIYAEKVETIDEDGKIIVDFDALDEISYEMNPKYMREIKQYGTIYAIRDINITKFKDIKEAARTLNINEEDILYFIKYGRVPKNREKYLNGYVFTTEKDK